MRNSNSNGRPGTRGNADSRTTKPASAKRGKPADKPTDSDKPFKRGASKKFDSTDNRDSKPRFGRTASSGSEAFGGRKPSDKPASKFNKPKGREELRATANKAAAERGFRSESKVDSAFDSAETRKPAGGASSRFTKSGERGDFKARGGKPSTERKPRTAFDPERKSAQPKGYKLDEKIRLNRFLSNSGVCSRREADTYISTGCVSVNGKIVSELGTKVSLNDDVRFSGQQLNPQRKVYLVLNKPKGYVTTTDDPQERKTVMDLIKDACNERVYPVGRLDRETTGVLLFTNDGDVAKKLTHPSFSKKKVYHVFLDKPLTKNDLLAIAKGVELEDGFIAADAINYTSEEDKKEIGIEIHSGKNRIVRRLFAHFGYEVMKLDRVLFAGLTKKNLPKGKWRFLTQSEINQLKMM